MASKSKSNFLLLLSAITLIIIVGGFFLGRNFSSPSQSSSLVSTANWKTYINTRYKYSVQYPPSYKISNSISEVTIQPDNSPFMYITKEYLGADTCPKFAVFIIIKNQPAPSIRAADYSSSIDINAFLTTKVGGIIKDYHNWDKPNKRLNDKTIDNKQALVFENTLETGNPKTSEKTRRLIVDNNEYYYIIDSCSQESSSEDWIQYNQILSTFRFD